MKDHCLLTTQHPSTKACHCHVMAAWLTHIGIDPIVLFYLFVRVPKNKGDLEMPDQRRSSLIRLDS